MSPIGWEWRGLWPYEDALAAQRAYRQRREAGEVPDVLWLLEHPPVITTGRRAAEVPPAEVLAAAGYARVETERGGLATCHEPGQLVGYLLIDARPWGVKRLVAALEEGLLAWVAGQGISAGRREGYPGVWAGKHKLAALGLHLERGFTMHGFALNLTNSLSGFQLITPCGITDGGVASVAQLTGRALAPAAVAEGVAQKIFEALLDG